DKPPKQYKGCQQNKLQNADGFVVGKQTPSYKGTKYSDNVKVENKDYLSSSIKSKYDESFTAGSSTHKTEKVKPQATDKAKETVVYIYLSEHVKVNDDLMGYIALRMGTKVKLPFEIKEVSTDCRNFTRSAEAKVTVSFPSAHTASKAMNLLHKSNRGTANKVFCFYTSDDAQEYDQVIERERKEKAEFDKSAGQMVETAAYAVNKHERKIRSAANHIQEIEQRLSSRKGVSLEVFSSLSQEKQAREDKLNELKSQLNEFKRYLTGVREKLKSLNPSDKSTLTELRKSLGTECHKLEEALPVYARREDILNIVKGSNVSVILGETGSGKSTQLVQYLLQAGFAEKGIIACTQPRKIAATSLARHVSGELASKVGQTVGYHVGMRSDKTKDTKILFMTDQVLLNECLKDETLSKFSFIIIDEAHERSIYTDLLLGMLKKCLLKRPELHIIITSATINPDIFVSYFGGSEKCPVLQVSGRTFPVEVFWDDDVYGDPFPEDYEQKAVAKAIEVHTTVPTIAGDILVFVTSPMEAERSCGKFSAKVAGRNFQCLQLHGKLKPEEQQLVFEPSPKGVRKIIFATNSAETSITIPGVKYVIDTGVVKEMRFDPKKKMNCLSIVPVSQSSSNQRKGRAGRTAPGVCYRLYSQVDFQHMEKVGKPEILRVNLGQALLKLLQLKVDPLSFDFVESPDKSTMEVVMATLKQLGAVEETNLTELGKWIANLPLEPRLGVLAKNGIELGVPIESLVIATCSSAGGVFFRAGSPEEKKKADLKKIRF
ncbi:MAG: helicase-related protein, partial [Candidatus Thiodiazotropha sp.]